MKRSILALIALGALSPAALAKPKKARERAKPRVLIFDAGDLKKRATFEYVPLQPEKVSAAPIFFTTVTGTKAEGSDEPEDVSVSEKSLMLDQGKTESPAKTSKK